MSASKSRRRGGSSAFEDIDNFWNTRDVSVASPDDTIGTDNFNYETSSAISESDLDESSVAPSVKSKGSMKPPRPSNASSNNSYLNTSADSSLPLEDSYISRRSSAGGNITSASPAVSIRGASMTTLTTPNVSSVKNRNSSASQHPGGYFNYDTTEDTSIMFSSGGNSIGPSSGSHRRVSFSAEKPQQEPTRGDEEQVEFAYDDNDAGSFEEEDVSVPPSTKKRGRPSKSKTPKAVSNRRYKEYDPKTPGSAEFSRGRQMSDTAYAKSTGKSAATDDADNSSESEDEDDSGFVDTSYLASVREKSGAEAENSDSDSDGLHQRRSKRVTKGMRYQFWKNERPVYEEGRIVGVLTAEPTPKKPKTKKGKLAGRRKLDLKSISMNASDSESDSEKLPFKLPTNYNYVDSRNGEVLQIWDEAEDSVAEVKVVSNRENLNPPSALPITADRPPGKNIAALAAQSFNVAEVPSKMSGWISGIVELPPQAIKDAEGVGLCSQVFFIGSCQDGSVELGIASPDSDTWDDNTAQRRLLSTGDTFYVAPGNIYRVENHSMYKPCTIYWTIIKPISGAVENKAIADNDY